MNRKAIARFWLNIVLTSVVGAGCAAPTASPTASPTALPTALPTSLPVPSPTPLPPDAVSGVVRDEDGPVAGATVRVQATTNATLTDDEGRFTLTGLSEGVAVTISAWNPTRVLSDNRLAAFATDTSTYTFAAPAEGEVTVEVALLFRRAFKELMDQKSWDVPDILMEWEVITLSASQ